MSRMEIESLLSLDRNTANSDFLLDKVDLSINEDHEYVLNSEQVFSRPHSVYFDKNVKVAEITYQNNYLSIIFFVPKQVNLFLDISTDFLIIETPGPLCVDGVLKINKAIKLKAKSVIFCNDVESKKIINFDVDETIIFEKLLTANSISVVADELRNMGELRIEKFADLAVKQYIQLADAICTVNGSLRILSDFCHLGDNFTIIGKSFIKSGRLLIGNNKSVASIHLQGEIYIDVDNIEFEGEAGLTIEQSSRTAEINIIVYKYLKVSETSVVNINNANLKISSIYNNGNLQIENCEVIIKKCYQKNQIKFGSSQVTIQEEFNQENDATTLIYNNTNKLLTFKKLNLKNGKLTLKDSTISGKQWNVLNGQLEVEDSHLDIEKDLYIFDPATFQLTTSTLKVKQDVILNGSLSFNGSVIQSGSIDSQGSQLKSTFQNSTFNIDQGIILWKNLSMDRVNINSYSFSMKGDVDADKVSMVIKDSSTWQWGHVIAKNIKLVAQRIDFIGNSDIEKTGCFTDSYFQGEVINHKGTSRFLNSEIHGNGTSDRSHGIEGKMQLDNSRFYTKSQAFHYKGSQTSLIGKSSLVAEIIANNGQIEVKESKIISKKLVQHQGTLDSQNSIIYVQTKVYDNQSKINLIDKSELITDDLAIDGSLNSKDSIVVSKKTLFSSKDSKIISEKSLFESESLFLIGAVKIAQTRLNTKQLRIYNQFSAMDSSILEIEEEMTIASKGAVELTKSQLSASKIELLGGLSLDQSFLESKENLESWSQSEIEMKGSSVIKAQDLVIRGKISTVTDEIKDKNNKSKKLMPQIHVAGKFETGFDSAITGDNLIIEAKEILVEGHISLSDSLVAKGSQLVNIGSIQAKDNIFLGFDDYVTNCGNISSNNVTIHSNLFNIFGGVYARKNFTNSGFVSLNMGLYCAANTSINSLVSLNSGLVLPNYANGLSDVFTWKNVANTGKIILTNVLPQYTNLINLGFMLPNIYDAGKSLYKTIQDYKDYNLYLMSEIPVETDLKAKYKKTYIFIKNLPPSLFYIDNEGGCSQLTVDSKKFAEIEFNGITESIPLQRQLSAKRIEKFWKIISSNKGHAESGVLKKLSKLRRHELMLIMGQIKSTGMLIYNASTITQSGIPEIKKVYNQLLALDIPENWQNNLSSIEFSSILNNFDYAKTAKMMLGAMGGSYHDDSFLHLNTGFSAHVNTSKMSLFHGNIGAELSWQFHSVNSHHSFNAGISYGGQSSFLARKITNYGVLGGANVLNIISTAVTNQGLIQGQKNNFDIELLEQNGSMDLSSGTLKVKNWRESQQADTRLEDLFVRGNSFVTSGTLKADKVHFEFVEGIHAEVSALLNLKNCQAKTANFTCAGTLNYQESLRIDSDLFHAQENSQIFGETSQPGETEKTTSVLNEQGEEIVQNTFTPKHALVINSKETILAGNQSGGDYTSIIGTNLKIEKSGTINLQQGYLKQETVINEGDLHIQKSSIITKKLTNDKNLSGDQIYLDTDLLEQKGTLNLSKGQIDARQFQDQKESSTTLNHISVSGDSMYLQGALKATSTTLEFKQQVIFADSSNKDFNNVLVKTQDFVGGGTTHYQNTYQVDTQTYATTSQSHLNGMKSETLPASNDSQEINPSKPSHSLLINAKAAVLNGQQSGGDYTQIVIEDSLKINGKEISIENGYIKSAKTEIDGSLGLENSHLDSVKTLINQDGQLSLDKSQLTGEDLVSSGTSRYNESYVQVDNLNFNPSATEFVKDSTFKTKVMVDSSQLNYQGQVWIESEQYVHKGKVQLQFPSSENPQNLFFLKSKTAELSGSAQIGNGVFDIENFNKSAQLIAGSENFSNYHFKESFDFRTHGPVTLTDKFQRDCNLYVTSSALTLATKYDKSQLLSLKSTEGNVNLLKKITAGTVLVDSAADIYTNHTVYADKGIHFTAKGGYYNLGGKLDGDVVTVQAAKILNITQESNAAKADWQYTVKKDGIINGRSRTLLEATAGDIENHGGVVRGGDYLQLVASGNILNICNEKSRQGKYDTITHYDPALIVGGKGASAGGLGLFVQAGGKVKCDASHFLAEGDIYIEGVNGVKFNARHDTYISYDKTKKKWYGKETHKVKTHTDIYHSTVHSSHGRSVIRSSQGKIKSEATIFSSAGGTDVYAQKSVKLFSLKTQDKTYSSKEYLWGLTKSSRKEIKESSAPTLFIDNGYTHIHSELGNVDARGALFLGDGDLAIKAGKRILFGRDVLNHKVTEKMQSISFSCFGADLFSARDKKPGLLSTFSTVDSTFAKLDQLLSSESSLEAAINSSNLGLNAFNTTNDLMRGIANNNVTSELLSRYSLGGADGFNPSIGINFNISKTIDEFQTLGAGGVERRNVSLEAGEGINLENGVRIHASGNMQIKTPEIIAQAAALESTHKHEDRGVKVGVTCTGQVTDVGVNYSQQQNHLVTHVNAEISADGHLDLGELNTLSLQGAKIIADTISGHIKNLDIATKQDLSHSTTQQLSASTSGQVSAYKSSESSQLVNELSGIHVNKGINHEGLTFTVDEYHTKGGSITSDGENNFKAQKVVSEELHDYHHQQGLGISLNIHDIERVSGDQKPTNDVGEKALGIGTITVDRQNFKAVQNSVIHGKQSTHLDLGEVIGIIHQADSNGYQVVKDHAIHVALDVPLTNREFLGKAQENITPTMQKIIEKPDIAVPEIKLHSSLADPVEAEIAPEIQPEITPEIQSELHHEEVLIQEALISGLNLASPEQQQEVSNILDQAAYELSEEKLVSVETQEKLNSVLVDVLLTAIKAGGEYGSAQIAVALKNEHTAVKCYMGTKGLIFSFAMNLGLSKADSSGMVQDAIISTVADRVVNFTMDRVLNGAAGPLGWVTTSVSILDKILYNEKAYEHCQESALSYVQSAYATEDPQLQQIYFEMADNKHELGAAMDILHRTSQFLEAPFEIAKGGIKAITQLFSHSDSPQPQPVHQEISDRTAASSSDQTDTESTSLSKNYYTTFNSQPKPQPTPQPEATLELN